MERRPLLLKATAVIGALAGCMSSGSESPGNGSSTPFADPPECANPERPPSNDGTESVDPVAYPETQPKFDNTEAVLDYIRQYERAYRTNVLLNEHGSTLESISISISDARIFDSPSGSAIGRVQYTFGYGNDEWVADSGTIFASYYIDDSVVARAEREGFMSDRSPLKPNPVTEGAVLECFGE